MTCNNELLFRLRRPVIAYERHTSALRVSVGDIGRQVLRSCWSTFRRPSCQCSGKRRHQRWADVVQSEREVTVSAQSQVSSTVSTVSRCTGQLWTATCPQCHRWPARLSIKPLLHAHIWRKLFNYVHRLHNVIVWHICVGGQSWCLVSVIAYNAKFYSLSLG